MTESARTATRNSTRGEASILIRWVAGFLIAPLAICAAVFWIFSPQKPVAEGSLNKVKDIQSRGRFKLDGARGIAIDRKGNIYVADGRNDRIVVYSPKGRAIRAIGGKSKRQGPRMRNPISVAVHGNRIFAGSYGTGEILVYDQKGTLLDTLPHKEDRSNLPLIHPLVMTTDSRGNLYAADGKNHFVAVFSPDGKLQLVFGQPGYGESEVSSVNGLAVDEKRRRIIVLSSGNLTLNFFNLDGKLLHRVSLWDGAKNVFVAPRGLAYNQETGTIYVAESIFDRVLALDENGSIVARSPDIGLEYPHGLALGPEGYLYVTNRESGKITVLTP